MVHLKNSIAATNIDAVSITSLNINGSKNGEAFSFTENKKSLIGINSFNI